MTFRLNILISDADDDDCTRPDLRPVDTVWRTYTTQLWKRPSIILLSWYAQGSYLHRFIDSLLKYSDWENFAGFLATVSLKLLPPEWIWRVEPSSHIACRSALHWLGTWRTRPPRGSLGKGWCGSCPRTPSPWSPETAPRYRYRPRSTEPEHELVSQ